MAEANKTEDTTKKKESEALKNPEIVKAITACHNLGLNTQGIKAQILDMEEKGHSLSKIRDYINAIGRTAHAAMEKQKFEQRKRKMNPAAAKASSESNRIQDPEGKNSGQMVPYFAMQPPVPSYELTEMNLILLHELWKQGRTITDPDRQNPWSFVRMGLEDFLDKAADNYALNMPSNERLKQIRFEYLKNLMDDHQTKAEKMPDDEITKQRMKGVNVLMNSNAWMDSIKDDNDKVLLSDFKKIRENVRFAMIEHLFVLDWMRFAEVNTPSYANQENLGNKEDGTPREKLDRSVDEVRLLRKGFIFLQMYQHVLQQQDQRGVFGYFCSIALDKNASW